METILQLVAVAFITTAGPVVIVLLAAQKGNLLYLIMNITDSQLFTSLLVALFAGRISFRLGMEIYNYK